MIQIARSLGMNARQFALCPSVHNNYGVWTSSIDQARAQAMRHYAAGELTEAQMLCQQILQVLPSDHPTLHLMGMVALGAGRPAMAEPFLRRSIAVFPSDPLAHAHLGSLLGTLGKPDESIASFEQALRLKSDCVEALLGLAAALRVLGKKAEAITAYGKSVALDPNCAAAHSNLAVALQEQGRLDEAETHAREAIRLQPEMADPMIDLGVILQLGARLDEAMACFEAAGGLAPGSPIAGSNLLLCMNYRPQSEPATLLEAHRKWGERFGTVSTVSTGPSPDHDLNADRRLRVGYVSPDFAGHPIAHFLVPILANHNPLQVEVFCYANQSKSDHITSLMKGFAHGWRPVMGLGDVDLADLIRSDRIDILVDLAGHTSSNRLLAFPFKPAPVQVTYLGYPNTTGLDCIDYRLTDTICDPPGEPVVHTEALFRMPRMFCSFMSDRNSPDPGLLPAQRAGFITFGSLHSLARLNCHVLDTWCRILHAVPKSRLVIFRHTLRGKIRDSMFRYIMDRGIAPDRVELAHEPPSDTGFPGVYQGIDISLDTFPWSGHTTACQSMWAGVPIITLRGNRFAGRMVASVLQHAGFPHLIAETVEQYIEIAAKVAGDVDSLACIRAGLRQQMLGSLLCDGRSFTQDLEGAYRQMWKKRCADSH